jgi:hypothetical protein
MEKLAKRHLAGLLFARNKAELRKGEGYAHNIRKSFEYGDFQVLLWRKCLRVGRLRDFGYFSRSVICRVKDLNSA